MKRNYLLGFAASIGVCVSVFLIGYNFHKTAIRSEVEKNSMPEGDADARLIHSISETLNTLKNDIKAIQEILPTLKMRIETYKTSIDTRLTKIESLINAPEKESDTDQMTEQEYFQEEKHQSIRARALEEVTTFDRAFHEEERDEKWATSMEESIANVVQKGLYEGSTFSTPECKATFCRIEAFHTNQNSRDKFELIKREVPNSYHIQHFEDPDGSSRSVLYLIREKEEENNIIFKVLGSS